MPITVTEEGRTTRVSATCYTGQVVSATMPRDGMDPANPSREDSIRMLARSVNCDIQRAIFNDVDRAIAEYRAEQVLPASNTAEINAQIARVNRELDRVLAQLEDNGLDGTRTPTTPEQAAPEPETVEPESEPAVVELPQNIRQEYPSFATAIDACPDRKIADILTRKFVLAYETVFMQSTPYISANHIGKDLFDYMKHLICHTIVAVPIPEPEPVQEQETEQLQEQPSTTDVPQQPISLQSEIEQPSSEPTQVHPGNLFEPITESYGSSRYYQTAITARGTGDFDPDSSYNYYWNVNTGDSGSTPEDVLRVLRYHGTTVVQPGDPIINMDPNSSRPQAINKKDKEKEQKRANRPAKGSKLAAPMGFEYTYHDPKRFRKAENMREARRIAQREEERLRRRTDRQLDGQEALANVAAQAAESARQHAEEHPSPEAALNAALVADAASALTVHGERREVTSTFVDPSTGAVHERHRVFPEDGIPFNQWVTQNVDANGIPGSPEGQALAQEFENVLVVPAGRRASERVPNASSLRMYSGTPQIEARDVEVEESIRQGSNLLRGHQNRSYNRDTVTAIEFLTKKIKDAGLLEGFGTHIYSGGTDITEVCSPVHKTKLSIFKWFRQIDSIAKKSNYTPWAKKGKRGGGGLHINISYNKKVKNWQAAYVNFFVMIANHPEINWIFNEPSDDHTANSLLKDDRFIKAIHSLMLGRATVGETFTDLAVCGGKSYAINAKSPYHFEIRTFRMPRSEQELRDMIDFANALLLACMEVASWGVIIPIDVEVPTEYVDDAEIRGYRLPYENRPKVFVQRMWTAEANFNALLDWIGLDRKRYKKYIRRNYLTRRSEPYGKKYMT